MSFAKFATVTASTKRPPAVSGGKRSGSATVINASLSILPLDPAMSSQAGIELMKQMNLESPFELLQTYVKGNPDIKEGDTLVVGSKEYPIKAVGDWVWKNDTFRHLLVQDIKNTAS